MFGKAATDEKPSRTEKLAAALDPAFAARQWSVHDMGTAARQRDVMRQYEQIRVTETLIAEQRETNRLLQALLERG